MSQPNTIKKLALGTVQFGLQYGIGNNNGRTTESEVKNILNYAIANGIRTLDTAYLYGDSEQVLGNCTDKPFHIISKFPEVHSAEELNHYFKESLSRLQVNNLYGYMAHRSDSVKKSDVWEALQQLKSERRISKIGYSLYTTEELDDLLDHNRFPDIIQVPFNILDRRFEKHLTILHQQGVEVHTRSAFLQGLFFQDMNMLSDYFTPVFPFLAKLNEKYPDANAKAGTLLNYCVKQSYIDKVVIGVNTQAQLQTNVESISEDGTDDLGLVPTIDPSILQPSNWPKN